MKMKTLTVFAFLMMGSLQVIASTSCPDPAQMAEYQQKIQLNGSGEDGDACSDDLEASAKALFDQYKQTTCVRADLGHVARNHFHEDTWYSIIPDEGDGIECTVEFHMWCCMFLVKPMGR